MNGSVGRLVLLVVLVLWAGGCASRSWTLSLFEKQEAEIDQRIFDVDRRVTTLETSVERTAALARRAGDLADIALTRTGAFDGFDNGVGRPTIARVAWEPRKTRSLLGVVHVRFGVNRSDLDDAAEKALLAVLKELRGNPSLTVDLEGTTDSTGSRDHNQKLSLRRVEAVRRFLLAKGVGYPRVLLLSAVGELREDKTPADQKRRVTVKLMQSPD
jgi:outer membrane protein OmpA-like peptidoglycan-associated protein